MTKFELESKKDSDIHTIKISADWETIEELMTRLECVSRTLRKDVFGFNRWKQTHVTRVGP